MKQDWLISVLKFVRLNLGILVVSFGLFVILVWAGVMFIKNFNPDAAPIAQGEIMFDEQISATATVVPTPSPVATPSATATPAAVRVAATPSATIAARPTPTVPPTVKPTPSPTPKPILTQAPIATSSAKPTPSPTVTPTPTPTVKPTPTPILTKTATATPSAKPTATPTPKPTLVPTATPSAKPTPKPTATPAPQAMTKGGLPIGAPEASAPTATLPADGKYTVQKGDSTWKLAQRFLGNGYRYVEIEKANNLKHNQHLEVGQVLNITKTAANTSEKVTAPGTQTEQQVTQPTNSGKSYTVKAGDTLWSIAQAQLGSNYRWSELYKLNKQVVGTNPGLIYPGQSLTLPATTSQTPGSTTPNPGK